MAPGTSRLTRLTDQLFTGADLPRHSDGAYVEELVRWEDAGITHLVDNRLEASDLDVLAELAPDLVYLENGEDDAGQSMPDAWFEAGVTFAVEAMTQPSAKVHVHCHMGINRGPSMALAVLLAQGWGPVAAVSLIRRERPVAAVAYGEQALAWWHRRARVPEEQRRQERHELAQWRRANPHDTVRLVQQVHDDELRARISTNDRTLSGPLPTVAS